ncbi:MAG: hypothetical protein WBQ63_10665, partial [Candidatus Acidiferrales bacterium]
MPALTQEGSFEGPPPFESGRKNGTALWRMRLEHSLVECGGLPPLFADRACPGVLPAHATCAATGS